MHAPVQRNTLWKEVSVYQHPAPLLPGNKGAATAQAGIANQYAFLCISPLKTVRIMILRSNQSDQFSI